MQQHPSHSEAAVSQGMIEESTTPDVLRVLWRWKWLASFGLAVGASLGYLYYRRQPPTYQSTALVQVVYPDTSAAGIETMDSESIRGSSRLDESMIIKSTRVVDLAIDLGKLDQQELLTEMTQDELRNWLLSDDRLTVEPSGRDAGTALLDISFVCEDENLSKLVVDSIIAGYETYLEDAYRSLGEDIVRVVSNAQTNLRESYQNLSEKHARFRKTAPMIWLGDEAQNKFAENNIEINNSINQIQIESQKLQAVLQHVSESQRQGRSPDAILLMLGSDIGVKEAVGSSMLESNAGEAEQPFSVAERRRLQMELKMKEEELLDTVGEEHPSVASIRRRLSLLDRQIDDLTQFRENSEHFLMSELSPREKLQLWKNSIAERLATLNKQESLLQQLADDAEAKSKELQEYLTQNTLLSSELASVQQLMDGFNNTLNRMQIVPSSNRRSLETLSPARLGKFYGPKWIPFLMGGAVVGFMAMAGIGFLVDWLDQSFRNPDEISSALGLPILGHIPQMELQNNGDNAGIDPAICTFDGLIRDANEAYRGVRTNVFFSESGESNRIIQVTSPSPGDGKSTLAANLAVSIAQSGRSVLLVDADMRRPRISRLFGKDNIQGIGEVILGKVSLADAIEDSPVKNLSLLASTEQMANPSEIVSHQRFQDVLDTVGESYDYVIVDTPPVLAVADACAVAARVGAVLMTFRLRRDSKPATTESARALSSVGAKLLGVVVNGVSGSEGYEYEYYGYGYDGKYVTDSQLTNDNPIALPKPKMRRRSRAKV